MISSDVLPLGEAVRLTLRRPRVCACGREFRARSGQWACSTCQLEQRQSTGLGEDYQPQGNDAVYLQRLRQSGRRWS